MLATLSYQYCKIPSAIFASCLKMHAFSDEKTYFKAYMVYIAPSNLKDFNNFQKLQASSNVKI